jgi:hypothetical protein
MVAIAVELVITQKAIALLRSPFSEGYFGVRGDREVLGWLRSAAQLP